MNVRSKTEIANLDEELNLFDEDEWDFFQTLQPQDKNYEYFNDIMDKEFKKSIIPDYIKSALIVSFISISCLVVVIIFFVQYGLVLDTDYEATKGISSTGKSTINYVDGKECSSEDLVEASKTLAGYFGVLRNKSGYNTLDMYCKDSSVFKSMYNMYLNQMKTSYDTNDCYARLLSAFGSYCTVNNIDKLIEKDGKYYCYVVLNMPSQDDIYEYVYLYQYNFTKHFMSTDATEGNIIRYLFDLTEISAIPCTPQEICLELEKDGNGEFKIISDSIIVDNCVISYTNAINRIVSILTGNLTESGFNG